MIVTIPLLLATAEFVVGVLLMHKAVPTVMSGGRAKAFKIWFLAAALLLFASVHIAGAGHAWTNHWVNLLAQLLLVAYAVQRYRSIVVKGSAVKWTEVT